MIVVWVGLLITVGSVPALAQTDDEAETADPPTVRSVAVEGNSFFSDGELKQRIRTEPNRRILSIPGLTW